MRVLVTGATGFVGTHLCGALIERGVTVRRASRVRIEIMPVSEDILVGEPGIEDNWRDATENIDCVVHLAARTHVVRETATDALSEYRRVNLLMTQALATAAAKNGVRRFVFLSSVKVNGEKTCDQPFTERDLPHPEDNYGMSKREAEQALQSIAAASNMETVVLRPPLIYGPGVKGNFLRLLRTVARGLPLPLASIRNHRSLLYVGNLVDAIILCLEHPLAVNKTYLLADDDSGVSTTDLLRGMAMALKRPARLLPFPEALLRFGGALCGKTDAVARLLGSLQIDCGKIRQELDWQPRYSMAAGLAQTAEWYYRQTEGKVNT